MSLNLRDHLNGGMDGDEPPAFIKALIAKITGADKDVKKEHVDFLTKEEVTAFNELQTKGKELQKETLKLKTMSELFWAQLKMRTNSFNCSLHIDEASASLLKEVEEEEK